MFICDICDKQFMPDPNIIVEVNLIKDLLDVEPDSEAYWLHENELDDQIEDGALIICLLCQKDIDNPE